MVEIPGQIAVKLAVQDLNAEMRFALRISGRDPKWRRVRNGFVAMPENSFCAVCLTRKHLNVHHIIPYGESPSLELEECNLITLCETPKRNCHFRIGHLKSWKHYNPHIVECARILRQGWSEMKVIDQNLDT